MILTSAVASSSLLLLLSLLLQPLLLLPLSLLLDILRALFFLAGALLTGDSSSLFSTDLSFPPFSWVDTSSLSLRLGLLTSCCSCASAEAADVDLGDGSFALFFSSPPLRIGKGESRLRLSDGSAAPASPPGVAWTMMSRILPVPPSLG
jgi:hypothetical protein